MDRSEWDADDENLDEGSGAKEVFYGRDGLIFLIDATKSMFVKKEDQEELPFKISLQCCLTTMKNKIISSDKDMIGVVLFGTAKKKNEINFPHVSVLQELLQPGAEIIKQLENMCKSDDFCDFVKEYGHSDDFSLSDALWLCQTTFATSTLTLNSRRILLFTNNDHPHESSAAKQAQARKKAKDIGENGMEFELLHMGQDFNPDLFYKDLLQIAKGDDSDDWQIPDPTNKFDELLMRVCRKDHKKRSVGRIRFTLGDGVTFGIAVYNLVRRTPAPRKIKLDYSTNEEVKSSRKKFDAETGAVVLPNEALKYQMFADKMIILKPEEIRQIKKITEPGLRLLGFKPASRIKMHYHVKPSSFIYPDDGLIQGSRKIFAALLQRCIERSVVPICCFAPRVDSNPSLVALVPQEELRDASNVQELPPGFHVVFLPYSDDVRKLDIQTSVKAEPEHIAKARQVIRKLRFKYSPYHFDNPKLQTLWRNIEAKALDPDPEDVRPVSDATVPDYDYMRAKLGSLSQEFLDEVYPVGYVPGEKAKPAARKRQQQDVQNEKQPKKEKVAADVGNMKELAEQGKVETLKVNDLKTYLVAEGIRGAGLKKAELVTKVYEHLGVPQP